VQVSRQIGHWNSSFTIDLSELTADLRACSSLFAVFVLLVDPGTLMDLILGMMILVLLFDVADALILSALIARGALMVVGMMDGIFLEVIDIIGRDMVNPNPAPSAAGSIVMVEEESRVWCVV